MATYYVKFVQSAGRSLGIGLIELDPDKILSAADVRREIAKQFNVQGNGSDIEVTLMVRMISGVFYASFSADNRIFSLLVRVDMKTIRSSKHLHEAIKTQHNESDWLKIHPAATINLTALSYIGAL